MWKFWRFWKRQAESNAAKRHAALLKKAESSASVSELLASGLTFAKTIRVPEFEKWVLLELNGYYSGNTALTNDVSVPRYRYIAGQRFNEWGQELVLNDPGLQFVNEYPIREGAEALERHSRKRGLLRFRDAMGAKLLEEHLGTAGVGWFCFPADSLSAVQSAVRARLVEWLHDPRVVAAVRPAPIALRELVGGPGMSLQVIGEHVTRIQHGLEQDPAQAIGSAKELAETVARHVLLTLGHDPSRYDNFPRAVKGAVAALDLRTDLRSDAASGAKALGMITNGLGQIGEGTATLRNLYGTGHGRANASAADRTQARLVVGACATLASFLIETLEHRT